MRRSFVLALLALVAHLGAGCSSCSTVAPAAPASPEDPSLLERECRKALEEDDPFAAAQAYSQLANARGGDDVVLLRRVALAIVARAVHSGIWTEVVVASEPPEVVALVAARKEQALAREQFTFWRSWCEGEVEEERRSWCDYLILLGRAVRGDQEAVERLRRMLREGDEADIVALDLDGLVSDPGALEWARRELRRRSCWQAATIVAWRSDRFADLYALRGYWTWQLERDAHFRSNPGTVGAMSMGPYWPMILRGERRAAVDALARLGHRLGAHDDVIEWLREGLADPEPAVVESVGQAITRLEAREAPPDESGATSLAAARADLASLDASVTEALRRQLADGTYNESLEAAVVCLAILDGR